MAFILTLSAMVLSTAAFVIVSQYTLGSIYGTLIYSAVMILCTLVMYVSVRKKYMAKIDRIEDLIINSERKKASGNEIKSESSVEHRLNNLLMSVKLSSDKIYDERKKLNSLISDIAHQIKTPLSNIILYTDILIDEDITSPYIYNIKTQAERLGFFTDAFIKISRCESGLIEQNLTPEKRSVTELIAKSVSDAFSEAEKKNITFEVDCDSSIAAIFDMRWTSEALFNIIDNSVKYSGKGSNVKISAVSYDIYVKIDVTDEGIGISEEDIQNICKRFYRGKNSSEYSGVGIGLYLSQLILSGENGYIKIKSTPEVGSTFSVFLPKA